MVVKRKVVQGSVMAKDDLYFRLRIPDDLKARVAQAAEGNRRSMTAEIVARLEASFKIAEADQTYALLSSRDDSLRSRLEELSSLIYEITDHARQARRLTEPLEHVSKYGFVRDDDDLTVKPPPVEAVSLTRDELRQLRDDEREAEGKPRNYGPRPTGEAGERLDYLKERLDERRKLQEIDRLLGPQRDPAQSPFADHQSTSSGPTKATKIFRGPLHSKTD